jgi:hypothetical protein
MLHQQIIENNKTMKSYDRQFLCWGCKPKLQKIPSRQIKPRHNRIPIDDLSDDTKGVRHMPLETLRSWCKTCQTEQQSIPLRYEECDRCAASMQFRIRDL